MVAETGSACRAFGFGAGLEAGGASIEVPEAGPLVSVVMPIYNGADFVTHAIASIQAQSYPRWELLVVDNCSTDQSPQLVAALAEADPRIRPIRRSVNSGGPAAPRNDGIRAAKGAYVTFLDADDLWCPDKLAIQVRHMEAHPETFMAFGRMIVDDRGILYASARLKRYGDLVAKGENPFANLLRHNNFIPLHTVILRNRLQEAGLLFDEDPQLTAVEDFDLWLQIASRGEKIDFLNAFFSIYRLHEENLSHGVLRGVRIQRRLAQKWHGELSQGSRLRFLLTTLKSRLALPLMRRLIARRFLMVVR